MRTFEYLFGSPELSALFWPAVVVGLLVSVLCAVLSPLVVLRRLSFIGQGVSHAAFAGVGVAMLLGMGAGGGGDWGVLVVVAVACVAAALGIAGLAERKGLNSDTAIGIVLVTAMALGFVLMQQAAEAMRARGETPSFGVESVLFGSVLGVRWGDVWVAGLVVSGELLVFWWFRRPLLFWAFDSIGASAVGVRTGAMQTLLLVLLALAIVVTMRLAGVVLATALLVLPGATALRCSDRLWPVFGISAASGLGGVAIGLALSFELDWQPGPAIVLTLVAGYVAARVFGGVVRQGVVSRA